MSIKIITGVLGAGKTYYAVNEILSKYFSFNDKFYEWERKDLKTDIEIITNIDSLKLPVSSFTYDMSDNSLNFPDKKIPRDIFFTIPFQAALPEKRRLFILDEAQKMFDRAMSPKFDAHKNIFAFFQWSRHMGYDVYLITQDITTLARELQNIMEHEVASSRRSFHLPGYFSYRRVIQGESIKRENIKKDSRVFMMYKSMNLTEVEKISSVPKRFVIMFALIALFVVFATSFFLRTFFPSQKQVTSQRIKNAAYAASQSSIIPVPSTLPVSPAVNSLPPALPVSHTLPVPSVSSVPLVQPLHSQLLSFNNDDSIIVGYLKLFDGQKNKEVRIYEKTAPKVSAGAASERIGAEAIR